VPRVLIIAKKEFKDHVSDQTFLLCFATLLIGMVGGALYMIHDFQAMNYVLAGQNYRNLVGEIVEKDEIWKSTDYMFTDLVTGQLSSMGVLLTIVMSLNTIQKERNEGSLRVLLSYPVYRDNLFFGKLLGGFAVLFIASIVSMVISFSLLIFYMAIPVTADFLLRVITTSLMSTFLLVFFLCLGIIGSYMFSDTSSLLLFLVLLLALLQYENYYLLIVAGYNLLSFMGVNLPKLGHLYRGLGTDRWDDIVYRTFCKLSPTESYLKLSERLLNFGYDNDLNMYHTSFASFSFQDQLIGNIDLTLTLIVFTVAAVVSSYIISTRRELP